MPYKAFISYSHEADGQFADELHDAMEKLAKPWTKRRARRVALDKTAMSAGSSLSDAIEEKLKDSEWLVLLAAPLSAQSKWVDDEIDYWAANKSMDKVVVALTGGEIAIDSEAQRVEWEGSTALSNRFRAAVGDDAVPLYEDLRPFKGDMGHANLRNPHFRDEIAKIVGRIEGQDPGELASEDQRQYKHSVRLRRTAEIGLVILTIAAVVAGVQALLSAQRALENEQQAISGAIAAQGIAISPEVPDLGALLALESMRIRPTVDAFISVLNSVVTPTHFRWRATVPGEPPIITAAASSSDGALMAMGTEGGNVWLMSPESAEPVAILEANEDGQEINSVAFAENDSELRVLDADGFLSTWNIPSGTLSDKLSLGELLDGAISGDGSTIAVIVDPLTIWVFDQTGTGKAQLDRVTGDFDACQLDEECVVAISDDGRALAWVEPGDFEEVVVIWAEGDEPSVAFVTPGFVTTIAFTPGGDTLVVAEDGGAAHLVPAHAGSSTPDDDEPDLFADAEFFDFAFAQSEDGPFVQAASAHLNGSVKLWDLDPEFGFGVLVGDLNRHNDEVRSVAYSPDGTSVVSGGWDGDIISWTSEATANHGTTNENAHQDWIRDVAFVGDELQLASVGDDGKVSLWNVGPSGQLTELRSNPLSDDEFVDGFSIDVSPDGGTMAVGVDFLPGEEGIEGGILLFEVASGEQVGTLSGSEGTPVSVTFSPEGRLAAGFDDGAIWVWDVAVLSGPPTLKLEGFPGTSGAVAFSGDGRFLAASDLDVIRVWDAATGAPELTVTGNVNAAVTAVSLNSDGTVLAWGDDTRLIGLWDIVNNEPHGQNLQGHREEITDLQFIEFGDGGEDALLVSTSGDAEARLWSVDAGRLVARIPAHSNDVSAVDVSNDQSVMVTSGHDGALWLGALVPETWIDAACALAGRNMSQAEWVNVQPDIPYVKHCASFPSGEGASEDAEVWMFEFTGVVDATE